MSEPRRALGKRSRATARARISLLRTAEDVTGVDAEEQSQHGDEQAGTSADRDLSAIAASAAHLRRIEIGLLVVLHVASPDSRGRSATAQEHTHRSIRPGRAAPGAALAV